MEEERFDGAGGVGGGVGWEGEAENEDTRLN